MGNPVHAAIEGMELPRYGTGDARSQCVAYFSDGKSVPVLRGRMRWYPRLNSSAPCMLGAYEAIAAALDEERVIWDVGCGTGMGTRILSSNGRKVVGIDPDPDAVEFARRISPRDTFCDLVQLPREEQPDAIVVVDVLALVSDPHELLVQLRRRAKSSTRLVVVEVRAFGAQSLVPPARRAFSTRSLRASLVRAGWQIATCEALGESLVLASASPTSGLELGMLERLEAARSAGDATQEHEALRMLAADAGAELACQANLELAELAFGEGDGDAAVTALRRAAELEPEAPAVSAGMSRLELAMGNPRDALMLAVNGLNRDPSDPRAAIAFAHATEQLAPEEAPGAWMIAGNLAPDDVAVLTQRARACAERGMLDSSIAALEQLRTYHPDQAPALATTLAWLLLEVGRVADAQLEARVATTYAPDDPDVLRLNRAVAEGLASQRAARGLQSAAT